MKVLITGAGGGLGGATVKAFTEAGWSVIPSDISEGEWSQGLTQPVIGVIGSSEWQEQLAERCDGHLDAVVAAHGIEGTGAILDLTPERVAHVMKVNFDSVMILHNATQPLLETSQGVFVAISSQAGIQGEPAAAAYCASKFAVKSLINQFHENSRGTIRYRTLCPGATETPLLRKAFEGIAKAEGLKYEDILNRRSVAVPVGRLGKPSDIGHAALWLAEIQSEANVVALISGGEILR